MGELRARFLWYFMGERTGAAAETYLINLMMPSLRMTKDNTLNPGVTDSNEDSSSFSARYTSAESSPCSSM